MSGFCGVVRLDGGSLPGSTFEWVGEMAAAASHRATRGTEMIRLADAVAAEQSDGLTAVGPNELVCDEAGRLIVADAWLHDSRATTRALDLPHDVAANAVISSAYRHFGGEATRRLTGEWAFVVWDPGAGRLVAARDPLGMRPLCYTVSNGAFIFASEIGQLLRHPDVPRRIRADMVAMYLTGDMGGPEDTFYEGIRHVPAGHTLEWNGSGPPTLSRYWPDDRAHVIEYADESEYVEHFLSVFTETVRDRLDTGVQSGISLSGGLDSGSVAAVAGMLLSQGKLKVAPPRTYSYAFESYPMCDERNVSDQLANAWSFPIVHVPGDDAWPTSEFPHQPPSVDEPLMGPFRGLNRRLAQAAAADGVEVVFTGLRGDTMMGLGIAEYLDDLSRGRLSRVWRQLEAHSAASGISIRRLVELYIWREVRRRIWPSTALPSVRAKLRRALARADPIPPWVDPDLARETHLERLLNSDGPKVSGSGFARRERAAAILSASDVREVGWLDRLYSQFGVRLTDPWSDRRIAEFAVAVPQRILNTPGADKALLRRAMAGVMPEDARRSTAKSSLRPLFDAGLRELGRSTIEDLLTGMVSAEMGFVREDLLRNHYDRYAGGGPGDFRLWWALTLEMWLRAHWSK